MMRIYTSTNDPVDLCESCVLIFAPNEERAFENYGHLGDGPDGRGNCFAYDCEHPPYSDDNYECEECYCALGEED